MGTKYVLGIRVELFCSEERVGIDGHSATDHRHSSMRLRDRRGHVVFVQEEEQSFVI